MSAATKCDQCGKYADGAGAAGMVISLPPEWIVLSWFLPGENIRAVSDRQRCGEFCSVDCAAAKLREETRRPHPLSLAARP